MNRVGLMAAGAVVALSLACGPNPAVYLVALDQSALAALPGSCYPNGTAPNPAPVITALIQHQFMVWEGAQGKRYLEIDQTRVPFPTSNNFSFTGLVEGGPKAWTFTTTVDRGNSTTETRSLAFNFSELGGTLLGSAVATSTCTCPTAPCGCVDCSATLLLNGRQIDVEPTGGI